jgi:hypothetical protein
LGRLAAARAAVDYAELVGVDAVQDGLSHFGDREL